MAPAQVAEENGGSLPRSDLFRDLLRLLEPSYGFIDARSAHQAESECPKSAGLEITIPQLRRIFQGAAGTGLCFCEVSAGGKQVGSPKLDIRHQGCRARSPSLALRRFQELF